MKQIGALRVVLVMALSCLELAAASKRPAWQSISAESMKFDLRFLAAPEFAGRNTPSTGLDIASLYLAMQAERIGLEPLIPSGSYFQAVPFKATYVLPERSHLRVWQPGGEQTFFFPGSFGVYPRGASPGAVAGHAVLCGLGVSSEAQGWNDFAGLNLKGKVAVVLDAPLSEGHPLRAAGDIRGLLAGRSRFASEAGAVAILTVISPEREKRLAERRCGFSANPLLAFPDSELERQAMVVPAGQPAIFQLEVRHDTAAAVLGVSRSELDALFAAVSSGQRLPAREEGRLVEVAVGVEERQETSPNVVAWLEGSDRRLKGEYVVISGHHDHHGVVEGRVLPGSDDNASGAAALLEIARAMMRERPRRSVIFLWATAEEKGMKGANYFVSHCPVPLAKVSAVLNLDMLTRNDPNSIYLVASQSLSRELDRTIRDENARHIGFRIDDRYQDPGHPERFFFRSDHLPFIRYGVPGVWFFCGTTPDYHQEGDTVDKADWKKLEKFTRLAYLTALEIGNREDLLPLDVNPQVTSRGEHNLKVNWWQALEKRRDPGGEP